MTCVDLEIVVPAPDNCKPYLCSIACNLDVLAERSAFEPQVTVLHPILRSKADMSVMAPFNHRADALRGTLPGPETKGSDGRQRHPRAAQLVLKAMFRPSQWNPAT